LGTVQGLPHRLPCAVPLYFTEILTKYFKEL